MPIKPFSEYNSSIKCELQSNEFLGGHITLLTLLILDLVSIKGTPLFSFVLSYMFI